MANIAYTEYFAEGQTEDLVRLMQMMQTASASVHGLDNEEANSLDLLVKASGGDSSQIECRGFWKPSSIRKDDHALYFEVETRWAEPKQWRAFLEKHFHLRMFYYVEQLGERIFETNDVSGIYFPYRYYFDGSPDSPYFETIDELCEEVGELTGEEDLSTFEDCSKAVSNYSHNHLDEPIILSKITVTI